MIFLYTLMSDCPEQQLTADLMGQSVTEKISQIKQDLEVLEASGVKAEVCLSEGKYNESRKKQEATRTFLQNKLRVLMQLQPKKEQKPQILYKLREP